MRGESATVMVCMGVGVEVGLEFNMAAPAGMVMMLGRVLEGVGSWRCEGAEAAWS